MSRHFGVLVLVVGLLAAVIPGPTPAAAAACESLSALAVPNTTITVAQSVPSGTFSAPSGEVVNDLPAFCRVAGFATPTSASRIGFEVWMPSSGWNGKFEGIGNGGFAGSILYSALAPGLRRGYATAGTDDGHTGGDARWALGHPERVVDFGYRAVHETAERAKAIIRAFYGNGPRHSYFSGCSDGGREALMEAQRFPDDYDGIIVGAPANFWTHHFVGFVWNEQATMGGPGSYIPTSKLPAIQAAALAACDALDGIVDGIIDDPRRCHFDPSQLLCQGADANTCLTAPQVTALMKIMDGPRNPGTGKQIFPGYTPGAVAAPGNWSVWITGAPPGGALQFFFGNQFFTNMVFEDPSWDFRTFDFDSDVDVTDNKLAGILNSTNPDLRRLKARGGKIIMYHGWEDGAIAPLNAINYYESVVRAVAEEDGRKPDTRDRGDALRETQQFFRLFMAPGMLHCGGGPGPHAIGGVFGASPPQIDAAHDVLSALDQWVDRHVAPDKIIATKYVDDDPGKGVAMQRPLCPYPQKAVYRGHGGTNEAANFACRGAAEHDGDGDDRDR